MAKKAKKLTAAEKQWIAKLEAVLAECPSKRIGSFTIGDDYIMLYDRSFDKEICDMQNRTYDFSSAVCSLECGLGSVQFPFPVHSTAG